MSDSKMDDIEKHTPPVVGEYAYYLTPLDDRCGSAYRQQKSKKARWIVTVNKENKDHQVFCSWSSNIPNLSVPFLTGHGTIISIDTHFYD